MLPRPVDVDRISRKDLGAANVVHAVPILVPEREGHGIVLIRPCVVVPAVGGAVDGPAAVQGKHLAPADAQIPDSLEGLREPSGPQADGPSGGNLRRPPPVTERLGGLVEATVDGGPGCYNGQHGGGERMRRIHTHDDTGLPVQGGQNAQDDQDAENP